MTKQITKKEWLYLTAFIFGVAALVAFAPNPGGW